MGVPLPPLSVSSEGARKLVSKLVSSAHKINTDDGRKVKSKPGRPASLSLQNIWDALFYPGWSGLGVTGPADPLDPLRAVLEANLHPDRPVPPWARKYVAEASKPIKATAPKPGDANYISPKMRAELANDDKAITERRRAEAIHDPPPRFRLPPLPGQASTDPHAVVQRLLATEQAKSMRYGRFTNWTTTAMKYGIPTPELITAALALRTTAEPWAIEGLAKKIQTGTRNAVVPYGSQARGNLEEIVWGIDPSASSVWSIYKSANAENYIPAYKP